MFGMGISEIIIIAVVAVIVLGPDKLPNAMVNIAKFFKVFKQTINGAKSTFEQEIKIAELKEDAKKYKDSLTNGIDGVRKKLTFEELDELKSNINSINNSTQKSLADIQNEISNLNPINKLNAGLELDQDSSSQPPKNIVANNPDDIDNKIDKPDEIQKAKEA
ncbi:Sec-independent protein translocase protein TatB [Campylobacter sp. CX2-4080-23]|uniref:Sec-independent protein translocase protein TatB n=1 Tax=Campylobacter porcelli TaxID=1660073 RepID=UPI002EC5A116|nr:Sec-independent protein translocase protein TatB [Campylobacter sp. CX2-4080-23]